MADLKVSVSNALEKTWPPLPHVYLFSKKRRAFLTVDDGGGLLGVAQQDQASLFQIRGLYTGYEITLKGVPESSLKTRGKLIGGIVAVSGRENLSLALPNASNVYDPKYLREWDFSFTSESTLLIGVSSRRKNNATYLSVAKETLRFQASPEPHEFAVIVQQDNELFLHWPIKHPYDQKLYHCPLCRSATEVGSHSWGFGNHLFHHHGPPVRRPKPDVEENAPTHCFSLIVVQHPETKKFLLVEEGANQGWWVPGGRVDPGETFEVAAIRECKEEAGIDIVLTGIVRIEHSPWKAGGGRERIIFYAVPKDKKQKPKSEPDYESLKAVWISFEELEADLDAKKKHLRGSEPLDYFGYVAKGGTIHSIHLLTRESSPIVIR